MDSTPLYRTALLQTFASEDYNEGQCETFIRDYDQLVKTGMSGETATAIVYSAWGASSPDKVCRTITDWIEKQMSHYNSSHKGITKPDGLNSLKSLIARINKNLDACSGIAVDGVTLSQSEIDAIKVNMPHCMRAATFTATASANNPKNRGCDKLVLEIRY